MAASTAEATKEATGGGESEKESEIEKASRKAAAILYARGVFPRVFAAHCSLYTVQASQFTDLHRYLCRKSPSSFYDMNSMNRKKEKRLTALLCF